VRQKTHPQAPSSTVASLRDRRRARYLAAHSPTERSAFQTADIARRLMRGGRLHEEADETSA
jgi:hypothetical protein